MANGPDGGGDPGTNRHEEQGSDATLDGEEFSAVVTALTAAFGDATRREIYLAARESAPGVTAAEVATRFALHPNVARHHLDKLAASGHLEVTVEGSGGAGRPSKRYRTLSRDLALELPSRRDNLLVMLLGRALGRLSPETAEQMAEEVGEEYGKALAAHMSPGDGQRSLRAAISAIADALTAHGFAAHPETIGASLAVVAEHCPFGDAAIQHPVICAVDRGLVRGMLATLCVAPQNAPVRMLLSSRARGDDSCAVSV
jgi:predicted ArsR family transcriptional regulator